MALVIKVEIREKDVLVHEIDVSDITVRELVEKLGLMPSEYVVVKNGNVITEEDRVVDGDIIILYPVKSGG